MKAQNGTVRPAGQRGAPNQRGAEPGSRRAEETTRPNSGAEIETARPEDHPTPSRTCSQNV